MIAVMLTGAVCVLVIGMCIVGLRCSADREEIRHLTSPVVAPNALVGQPIIHGVPVVGVLDPNVLIVEGAVREN